jgi:hypothetical protein
MQRSDHLFYIDLEAFRSYLSRNGFPALEIWKCEVTYINHLFQGRGWTDAASLSSLFPTIGPLRRTAYSAGFELPDNDGTLQLELVPGLSADGRNLVQLSITAAGAPMNGDVDSIMEWVDKGRYAVVKCFSDVTSDEVQSNVWERI